MSCCLAEGRRRGRAGGHGQQTCFVVGVGIVPSCRMENRGEEERTESGSDCCGTATWGSAGNAVLEGWVCGARGPEGLRQLQAPYWGRARPWRPPLQRAIGGGSGARQPAPCCRRRRSRSQGARQAGGLPAAPWGSAAHTLDSILSWPSSALDTRMRPLSSRFASLQTCKKEGRVRRRTGGVAQPCPPGLRSALPQCVSVIEAAARSGAGRLLRRLY